ncbi:HAD-IIA family hydrolase [Paracoccus sediminicola]|uniref:HAD-IIA family hydrolase n=1 Tax=Paracoccus sediminicola TaxID=3017783 RepID=UPI0022F10E49|nr:HAD-IIA family hydrolase [Paracoccus sediminicola]WBU56198.1 HAD-IIA family hydrolase [Paracoccus sediminicola]
MMELAEAFAAYEAARDRLPQPSRHGAARAASDLSEIADRFDVFLLDAFGVLNIGECAIPGVVERLQSLRDAGKTLMVVSNAASLPHEMLMRKYAALGYDFAPGDVITSRKAMMAALETAPPRRWGLMSSRAAGLGELATLDTEYLEDEGSVYDRAEGVLMVGTAGWTETRQRLLEDSLRNDPRPVWVGNPDIVAPRENGFSQEPGYFAHRLADATGIAPQFYGKPFGNIFDLALARLPADIPLDRILMVGDSPHTDILGANTVGIASALVAGYGFLGGAPARAYLDVAGIYPDFVLDRP